MALPFAARGTDVKNWKRLLSAVPTSRLVDPSTAELHPRSLEAFSASMEEVVGQLESMYMAGASGGGVEVSGRRRYALTGDTGIRQRSSLHDCSGSASCG
jgi:hypothetical protein